MKKLLITLSAIVLCVAGFAEQTSPIQKTIRQDPFNHPMFPAFLVMLFVGVVLVLLIIVEIYLMRITRFLKTRINCEPVIADQPALVVTSILSKKKVESLWLPGGDHYHRCRINAYRVYSHIVVPASRTYERHAYAHCNKKFEQ